MNDINKISDTLNNMEDIDFFFESSNQDYIKYLKGDISKNISKYSTKDKTGFSFLQTYAEIRTVPNAFGKVFVNLQRLT